MSTLRLINVEGPLSWKGSYADAVSQDRAKGLDERCTICFQDYKPSEQVIILPCTHGLHSNCFENWEQQNCPFDRSFVQFEKIFILGQEIAFNPKARKFAVWLSSEFDKINDSLEMLIIEIFNPEELEKFRRDEDGILKRLAPLFKIIVQDFLDRYAKTSFNTYEGLFSDDQETRANQLVKAAIKAVQDISSENLAKALNSDIEKKIKLYRMKAEINRLVAFPRVYFNAMNFFDDASISHALWLIYAYVCTLQESPEFKRIIEEVDRQFYKRHFEALNQIAGENDTYFSKIKIAWFLYKMEDLDRFISVNDKEKENNPLALRIERVDQSKYYAMGYAFAGIMLFGALSVAWDGLEKVYSLF